jgi:hypothetical protein
MIGPMADLWNMRTQPCVFAPRAKRSASYQEWKSEMIRKTILVAAMAASATLGFVPAFAQTAQQKEQASNRAREANSQAHVYAYQHRNARAQKQQFYRAREENSRDHVEAYQHRNDTPQQKANAAREENSQDHVDAYNNRPH